MFSSKGPPPATAMLSREPTARGAVLNALDRLAGSYPSQCDAARQELAIAEGQLRDHEARLGAPFPHDAYLGELIELTRPAQSRPVAGDTRSRHGDAARRRAGRADQSLESRPHHRGRARAHRHAADTPPRSR